MKTIKVKPVEKMYIELKDRTYICAFNMAAMAIYNEEISKLDGEYTDIAPARHAAIVLYSGIRQGDDEFTMEEAVALTIDMGPGSYGQIMELFNASLMESLDDKQKAFAKKLTAQYISNAMR